MVPLSNYYTRQKMKRPINVVARTYVNTRRKPLPGKFQLKVELIDTGIQSSLSAQRLFILKEGGVAIAKVLRLPRVVRRRQPEIRHRLVRTVRILVDPHKSMKADREVSQSYRLDDGQHDRAFNQVAWRVLPMGFVGADVEVSQVASARLQRRGQSRQQRPTS